MYDSYNSNSYSAIDGFELLGKAIVYISENFWWILLVVLGILFVIKILSIAFWTGMITDTVTSRLEKQYNEKLEEIIKRLEPKESIQSKPSNTIDVAKYENNKIKL